MPEHPLIDKLRRSNWKKIGLIVGGSIVLMLLLLQLFYPGDRLPLAATIDDQALGGKTKSEAAAVLNAAYAKRQVAIYMGSGEKPVVSPKFADMDVSV